MTKTTPESKPNWNDDFGDWQGLASDAQHPRYQQIARIVSEACPRGSVLEVGCGEALLAGYFPGSVTYTGIEPSAKASAASKVPCHHTTAEAFSPGEERWDCIIFNEMLYYSKSPQALLEKFSRLLRPGGIIVISIYQKQDSWRAWLKPSMNNARCTRIVKRFIARNRWTIEQEQMIAQANREPWWLIVVRPR